jgi:2-methylcitrate dehydratase PrpD
LSRYIASALQCKLPAEVGERARVHLVDAFAAMVSGSRLTPGKRAIDYVKSLSGGRESGVVGTRGVSSAFHAALANGMCAHADETDDTHPPTRGHPGSSIVPAVLAMAERQQLSGEFLLRAMVLGYDINARVLLALKPGHLRKIGQHPGSKGGVFGAASSAAALLKLPPQKIRHVLAYCGQQAAGIYTMHRESQHVEKAFAMGGMPAHNGICAALMVACGFTGVEDVFSGEPNFLGAFSPDADPNALVRGLGHDYEIMRCGIKRWSAGGPIQGPLHGLQHLIRQHGFRADDVEKLVVRMPAEELKSVDNRDTPDITIQHLLAVMLLDGTVNFATAHDFGRMKDRKILALRKHRIEVIGTAIPADPLRNWSCDMDVRLTDGRSVTHRIQAAKGGAANPLTREEEEEKALDLMSPILGKRRSKLLIASLLGIEKIDNARALRKLYAA